ncbi:MAG TPA: serine hydrolase domain-containing protein [Candidatus Binataceae bacterium]|nr:serine hydrolase domain-containing protein [Candidatus Binataceae bacterium]
MGWREVEGAFNDAVARRVFPGATVTVRRGGAMLFEGAFGSRTLIPESRPMQLDTVFDVASLTKVLATTIAVMMLVREEKVRLDDRVTRFFSDFSLHGKERITLRHLLAHCSGLPAWRPFFQLIGEVERGGKVNIMATPRAKHRVYEEIHREKLEAPTGSRAIYSDLNFMLLGEVIEHVYGVALDRFCHERIFRPLRLAATGFIDLALARTQKLKPVPDMFAATEECPTRKRILIGEVDDENAYAMGGVAGHAGLFASVREVDRIAAELIASYEGTSDFVEAPIIREFWTRDKTVAGSTWALGWDTPSPTHSSSGHHFPSNAVGHLGFTGTSLWIDPERRIAVTILTNRVHPSRENHAIREFRPHIHDLIMEAIDGA